MKNKQILLKLCKGERPNVIINLFVLIQISVVINVSSCVWFTALSKTKK